MTLAVPQEKLPRFLALAAEMDVAVDMGEFTDSGLFQVEYDGIAVACLQYGFHARRRAAHAAGSRLADAGLRQTGQRRGAGRSGP